MVAVGVVVGAVVTSSGSTSDVGPVSAAQPFTLGPVVQGAAAASLAAVPGRTTLVAFFAAWCEPCKEELPLVEAAAGRPGAPAVVGVDVMDQRPDAADLVRQAGVTFPAGFDHDGSASAKWGVVGLPVTVLVGADGRIIAYHRGQLSQHGLDTLLKKAA